MKDAIYTKLKQAYSPLGLGDAVLMGHAEALDALGYVTEDNVDAAVAAQKGFLEQLQKANDARAQGAAQKAREAAEKAAAEAAEKAAAEAARSRDEAVAKAVAKAVEEAQARADQKAKEESEKAAKARKEKGNGEIPEWFATSKEETAKAIDEIRAQASKAAEDFKAQLELWRKAAEESEARQKESAEALKKLASENERMKAEAKAKERTSFIAQQAAGMGIPQYRIDEGFAGIGPDSTDDEITAALATVARNVKANQLPEQAGRFPMADGKPSESELQDLAKMLVK